MASLSLTPQSSADEGAPLKRPSFFEFDEGDSLFVQSHDIDEDVYGFAITSVIRDTSYMARTHKSFGPRAARACTAVLVVLLNVSLQAWLLYQIKKFVTPAEVASIRDAYSDYEYHMYGDDALHTIMSVNGKYRGLDHDPSWFNASAFATLPDDEKERVCHIPLSQPGFLMTILLIWTLTCTGSLRSCFDHAWWIVSVRSLDSMEHVLSRTQDDDYDEATHLVEGLTLQVKVFLLVIIIIPRFLISCYLLWLGCRWLTATMAWDDIVLNGVALEFILATKDLLFTTILPTRNIRDVRSTKISFGHAMPPTYFTFLAAFVWLLAAMVWTILYTFVFQQVLPGYRWDVRKVCEMWIHEQYCGDPGAC